jgi:hypothetical protein
MKRPRRLEEWLSLCVVTEMKRAKQSEDAAYIADLEAMVSEWDGGLIWPCSKAGCTRICRYDENDDEDEEYDESLHWVCYLCQARGRANARYCVVCMPPPYESCIVCQGHFCPNCAFELNKSMCLQCAPDEDDLDLLMWEPGK